MQKLQTGDTEPSAPSALLGLQPKRGLLIKAKASNQSPSNPESQKDRKYCASSYLICSNKEMKTGPAGPVDLSAQKMRYGVLNLFKRQNHITQIALGFYQHQRLSV